MKTIDNPIDAFNATKYELFKAMDAAETAFFNVWANEAGVDRDPNKTYVDHGVIFEFNTYDDAEEYLKRLEIWEMLQWCYEELWGSFNPTGKKSEHWVSGEDLQKGWIRHYTREMHDKPWFCGEKKPFLGEWGPIWTL